MEHFKGISVKKPSFAYRYSNSEQHGRTLGFAELRDARFIWLSLTIQRVVFKGHRGTQPGRQIIRPNQDPEIARDFEAIHVASSEERCVARDR